MLSRYLMQNWTLILVAAAFFCSLKTSGLQNRSTEKRMYLLIVSVLLLSVVVFREFYLAELGGYSAERTVLMAVRYSATPLIVAMVLYTLQGRMKWFIFIPALLLCALDILSIFTGIVFGLTEEGVLRRGPLGYLPFIVAGLYGVCLVVILYRQSNRLYTELIPIIFLALAFASGLILPFLFGPDFAQMFCPTILISLYVYYVFSIHQLSKKDPLTGVLNRQAFYIDSDTSAEDITALVSIDMNGLKQINDTQGHAAGDEALVTLAGCFRNAADRRQALYRIGGDEFVLLCRDTSEEETAALVARIRENVAETKYRCSIGWGCRGDEKMTVDEMLRESDRQMYAEKARYYSDSRTDRRRR